MIVADGVTHDSRLKILQGSASSVRVSGKSISSGRTFDRPGVRYQTLFRLISSRIVGNLNVILFLRRERDASYFRKSLQSKSY